MVFYGNINGELKFRKKASLPKAVMQFKISLFNRKLLQYILLAGPLADHHEKNYLNKHPEPSHNPVFCEIQSVAYQSAYPIAGFSGRLNAGKRGIY